MTRRDRALPRRALALSAFGLAALAAASPALAISPFAAPTKSAAILGGATSSLDAILTRQGAPSAAPAALTFATAPAAFVPDRPAASSDRPDVFGSVALKIDRSRLDHRWRAVSGMGVSGPQRSFARSLRTLPPEARLALANRYVNRSVTFVDDSADVWSAAADTLRRGRGDCEDFAIAKLQLLREAGFSPRDLYLVIARDLARRQDHAVLIVRSGGRYHLLDNGTDIVLDSERVRDYLPVLTFSSEGVWTHGYRVERDDLRIAQTGSPIAPAADQRSRSASLLAFNTGLSR